MSKFKLILDEHKYDVDGKVNRSNKPVIAYARAGTSDVGVLKEVIDRHCYTRRNSGFDVRPGELWLDLGANIGAFALYCRMHDAQAECYEPDPDCFTVLKKNAPRFDLFMHAVTNRKEKELAFRKGRDPNDHYRATILTNNRLPAHPSGTLANRYASCLKKRYDGIKMDIEGSEFGLLDDDLLPRCQKLTMEYHFLRDERDLGRFAKRMKVLRRRFKNVVYPKFIDRDIEEGRPYSGRFDTQIFAWEAK